MKKGVDYIGVGAGAIIFNNEGKVFVAQRGPGARNEAGKWDFPGGGVEFGEKCADAVVGEIKEEFEMDIKVLEFLEVLDHFIPQEKQHWVSPSYIAKHINGEPKNIEPHKCLGFKWVDIKDINPDDLSISSRSNYNKFVEKYGKEKTF
ncbi:MAG: NUDIX domain-containing protein [Candidatus Pacebacteria bacterium]|nr:NUDIX domain-containing protein [Candidatus Paceibacterota bacterium]